MVRRRVFEVVGLVEKHRPVIGQKRPGGAFEVTHGKIGEKERMVGHDDVGLLPLPPGLEVAAVPEVGALGPHAVAGLAADQIPDLGIETEVEILP